MKKVQPRKPYRSPMLQSYGDIRAITRNVGQNNNNKDGGMGNMSKQS